MLQSTSSEACRDKVRKCLTSCSKPGCLCSTQWAFYKQLNFVTSAVEATRRRSAAVIYWSSRQLDQGSNPRMTDGARPETSAFIRPHYPPAADPDRPDFYRTVLDLVISFSKTNGLRYWGGRGGLLSATPGWLLLMIHLVFRACPDTCWLLLSVHRGLFTFQRNTLMLQSGVNTGSHCAALTRRVQCSEL